MRNLLSLLLLLISCSASTPTEKALNRQAEELEEALSAQNMQLGDPIFIRIFKQEKALELWVQPRGRGRFQLFKRYPICTYGPKGLGPKLREGDKKAPEGFYYVPKSRLHPGSKYHLAFNLGYPNTYDEAHGRTGSALMVHGDCVSIGCYAMTDPVIEEIYALAKAALDGRQEYFRVHCFPFHLTTQNLQKHQQRQWYSFWKNLKEGYAYFEEKGVPPNVTVKDKRYLFE